MQPTTDPNSGGGRFMRMLLHGLEVRRTNKAVPANEIEQYQLDLTIGAQFVEISVSGISHRDPSGQYTDEIVHLNRFDVVDKTGYRTSDSPICPLFGVCVDEVAQNMVMLYVKMNCRRADLIKTITWGTTMRGGGRDIPCLVSMGACFRFNIHPNSRPYIKNLQVNFLNFVILNQN